MQSTFASSHPFMNPMHNPYVVYGTEALAFRNPSLLPAYDPETGPSFARSNYDNAPVLVGDITTITSPIDPRKATTTPEDRLAIERYRKEHRRATRTMRKLLQPDALTSLVASQDPGKWERLKAERKNKKSTEYHAHLRSLAKVPRSGGHYRHSPTILTSEQKAEAIELFREGCRVTVISRKFGCSHALICRVVKEWRAESSV